MTASRSVLVAFLVALAGGLPASAAVEDYIGKPVASVRLTIESRETVDPTLTQVIQTAAGAPLSMIDVRETIAHLYGTGRFEGVSVEASLDSGGVTLRYELTPIHLITRITFAGTMDAPGVDRSALKRALTDRFGATPPLGRAAEMAHVVEAILAERGYLHATVTPEAAIEHAPERASVVLTVDANARTKVGTIEIVGRPVVARRELLSRLGLTEGGPFQRDRLTANIERYVADRRENGYYEARIVPTVRLDDEDRVANITLTIAPGPHVKVVFAGDSLPSDRRDELVPVSREGSVDEDLLEDSSHRIEEYFRAQGYRNARAPYTREERDGELLVTFTIAKGALHRVSSYEISGNESVPLDELTPILRLRAGQAFSDNLLDADLAAIGALYRRRGFATVRVLPAIEPQPAAAGSSQLPIVVRIVVNEGARTTVEEIDFEGNSSVDAAILRSRLGLQSGGPYVQAQVSADRDAIQLAYQELGYQNVRVDAVPRANADQTRATVDFRIQEGPRVYVDHVIIVGNVRTRAETIERELQVKAGDPYNLSSIVESQRRLAALGLFRRVRISELRHGNESTRDLLVAVEEAPPMTIGYGVGAEGGRRLSDTVSATGAAVERFDIAPRALFEIGRRNLFGKNRSANLFTSLSRSVVYSLTEYRAVATFREPRLFDTAADAFINGTVEQQHRSTFDFARRSFSANVERRFSGPYRLTGTYQLQRTHVFNSKVSPDDLPLIDRTFPQFLLSSFSGAVIRDTRDDPVDSHDGAYASANTQLAAKAIGSEVGFVKTFVTAQVFRPVPHLGRVVFAGSARIGMASGFTIEGDLPASERFFAGGNTTVRGFALDQLGVRHIPPQPEDTVDENGFAIGGNGLTIFNAELRMPVTGGLGIVGFLDTGNVFKRVTTIDLADMRSAVGGGVRYKSPVGPLRFDIGFKVKPLPGESRSAWFVSFGQAF